jgi:putative SOS response-associated peptidase YedK
MFKAAFAKRRCLVPAPVYYEWRDDPEGKTPFAVAASMAIPSCLQAFGRIGAHRTGKSYTFSTITTNANRQLAAIQGRMPVIIEKADWPLWLGEAEGDVPALLRPLPEGVLRTWPIDKRIGQVRNDGPELLEPREASEEADTAEQSLL